MNQFLTGRDAKEYLIRIILAQADQDGVSLSDVERKMLYFSETCWTLPDMMDVSRAFDENYNQDEYEKKIGQIIRRIHKQPDRNRDDSWDEAVRLLRKEDHYLVVLIDGAGSRSDKFSLWEIVKLILAGAVAAVVFLWIIFFIDAHVSNRTASKLIGEIVILAVVALVWFVAHRRYRNSA